MHTHNDSTHAGQVFDTPEAINAFQMLATRSALKLEILGLRHSRGSVAAHVRRLLGSKTRDRRALLVEFEAALRGAGILREVAR